MPTPVLPDYTAPFKPVPNVTPFTIRDGATMLKKLDYFNKYIERILLPWINTNFGNLADKVEASVQLMVASVNEALATQSGIVTDQLEANELLMTNLETFVNDQVQLIIEDSIQVQDPVVAGAIADEDSATNSALNNFNRLYNRPSIMLRDYITPGATSAANRAAYQNAVNLANAGQVALCYDGAFFSMTGEPVAILVGWTKVIHWATGVDTHKIIQLTRGKGPIRTAAPNGYFENLNLDGNNPTLAGFTGQNVAQSAGIFIEPTANGTVVRGGYAAGFKCGVFATIAPYALLEDQEMQAASIPNITTDFVTYPDLTNITVDGLHSEGCWAAFVPQAIKTWEAANISGWYQKMPQSGSEAHLIYPTAVGSRYGTNFTMHDCIATGGDERHAFRPRGQRNGKVWNLRAVGCPGLIQVLECEDIELGYGLSSYDDKLSGADGSGSISINASKRIKQAPASVVFRVGHVAPPGGSIESVCEDVIVNGISVVDNSPSTNPVTTTAMYKISSANIRCELNNPDLRANGAGAARYGVFCSTASDDVVVTDPVIRGNVTVGIRVSAAGPKIIYTPGLVEGATKKIQLEASGVTLVNRLAGFRPDLDKTVLCWHSGEVASESSTNPPTVWGNGQTRSFANGTWTSDPNLAELSTSAGGLSTSACLQTPDADVSAQVKRGTTTRAGLQVRANSVSDTLAFVLTATGAELIKYVSGTTTVLATYSGAVFPGGAFADVRCVAVGTQIIGYVNGVQVISHTLTGGDEVTYVSGNHGIFVNTSGNPLAKIRRPIIRSVA